MTADSFLSPTLATHPEHNGMALLAEYSLVLKLTRDSCGTSFAATRTHQMGETGETERNGTEIEKKSSSPFGAWRFSFETGAFSVSDRGKWD